MSEAPAPAHQPRPSDPEARVAPLYRRAFSSIPPKARVPAAIGLLLVIGLAIYLWGYSGDSSLNIVCRHDLRSGRIAVVLDGESIYSGKLSGVERRRFGVLDKRVEGLFSKTLTVPSGEHVLTVNVSSDADGYDQTRQAEVNFSSGRVATLRVTAQRGSLSLAYQGPAPTAASSGTPDYIRPIRSILFTAAGSVASAAIGFMVQEFLKSRKAAAAKRQATQSPAAAPADRV